MRTGAWTVLLGTALAMAGCHDDQIEALAAPLTATRTDVAPIKGGNALTLPAQRHLVRLAPGGTPRWLLAVQQDGADNHGLGFFRSDDDGASWRYAYPIQDDWTERDTTDLVVVGNDVAMVYSYEGPTLSGSTRHDVWFQWWRWNGTDFVPSTAVRVFDSTSSSTAYYRAELARDSVGRLWVQAFRLNADGSSTARIAVSTDGGSSFTIEPDLASLAVRGGGRLLSLGTRLVFVWDGHDSGTPAHVRTRDDAAPLGSWGATAVAFPEGIYHGAALSAVADGIGGMHLVYKDETALLWYRRFDGATFGPSQLVEDVSDWELQPAITRVGADLWIFYNRVIVTNTDDEIRVRALQNGVLGAPSVLDSTVSFKGYPAAVDVLATGTTTVPCFWGVTPTANDAGRLILYSLGIPATPTDGGVDLAAPRDLATPRDLAAPRDLAMSADLASPADGGTATLLFSDDFNRAIAPDNGLGARWSLGAGLWWDDGSAAQSDSDRGDLAAENVVACRDCRAEATVIGYGVAEAGVFVRAPSPTAAGDRYALVLTGTGRLRIVRVRAGVATVLADVPSNVATAQSARLSLEAVGAGPVTLTARVDGVVRSQITDSSASVLGGAGYAGLWTTSAGVPFDDFALSSSGSAPPPPADLAVPADLSTSPPPPDLASADLATSGPLFSDSFTRSIAPDNGLGAGWAIAGGLWWVDGQAESDQDTDSLAVETVASCRDCTVKATVTTYGTTGGVALRAPSASSLDRYDLVLLANLHVQLRRVRGGTVTVLADAASGLTSGTTPAVLALTATGAGPVTLSGSVGGVVKVTATDSSSAALGAAGWAGLTTSRAGVSFDDFVVR